MAKQKDLEKRPSRTSGRSSAFSGNCAAKPRPWLGGGAADRLSKGPSLHRRGYGGLTSPTDRHRALEILDAGIRLPAAQADRSHPGGPGPLHRFRAQLLPSPPFPRSSPSLRAVSPKKAAPSTATPAGRWSESAQPRKSGQPDRCGPSTGLSPDRSRSIRCWGLP